MESDKKDKKYNYKSIRYIRVPWYARNLDKYYINFINYNNREKYEFYGKNKIIKKYIINIIIIVILIILINK